MRKQSGSRTRKKDEVVQRRVGESVPPPGSKYTPDLSPLSIMNMLTEDQQRELDAYLDGKDKSEKLALLLESSHDLKTKVGEVLLGLMSRRAMKDSMSYDALYSVLPLRAELAKELNVKTISQKMLLEAALVCYARFMGFQEAASAICLDVNTYSAPVLGRFHQMALEALKMFQDTIELLKVKDRPPVRILVNDSQVNLADVQQVVNKSSSCGDCPVRSPAP